MRTKTNGLAFTLEFAVYCLCIIIFLSLAAYFMSSPTLRAKQSQARSDVAVLGAAVSQYHYEVGSYPGTLNDLLEKKTVDDITYGPWITGAMVDGSSVKKDPWNRAYVYEKLSNDAGFIIYCPAGKDKSGSYSESQGFSKDTIGVRGK